MRILITGATGFIGSHLMRRLADEHEIVALVRRTPPDAVPGVQYVNQDLRHPLNHTHLPDALDAIIHQAALIDTEGAPEELPFLVNVVATWRLLKYAAAVGVRAFVHASTGGVYGCGERPFMETDPLNPMDLYSLTKAQAELAVLAAPGGFRKIVLRYFFPYGIGTPNPIPHYVRRALAGEPIRLVRGGGPQLNPLHIADAVEATVRALTLEQDATMNIAGPEITTFREIAEIAARSCGKDAIFQELTDAEIISYYRSDLVADITHMIHTLNFTPHVSLRKGLAELIDHYHTREKLP